METITKKSSPVNENVDLVEFGDRRIFIIGTAHVSQQSADLVESVIREHKPDVVCVELCDPRLQSLQQPERWRETDLFNVIKSGRGYVLLAQLMLASFQKRLAEKFGIEPGAEMRRAVALAPEVGADLVVVDREIRTTLKRAWAKAGIVALAKIVLSLLASVFEEEEISEEEIEALKEGDALAVVMSEFAEFLPGVKDVLIDERDRYMAEKIFRAGGKTLVAVIGAGHVPGILSHIGTRIDLSELDQEPPPNRVLTAIAWGVPLLIMGVFAYGFFGSGIETGTQMFSAWFLANGVLAALGAMLALAHPLTVLTAFIAAPFTSLNPTIGAGWVCGLVEVFVRKPRVGDLETIADDIATFSGFWRNRVSRVLLVMALSTLGSVVGTVVGAGKVVSLLP